MKGCHIPTNNATTIWLEGKKRLHEVEDYGFKKSSELLLVTCDHVCSLLGWP